jgi:predicted signal transduction protein with EAL and GGDEF domain
VTLARGLDMSVPAEGVETPEQFKRLKTLGVQFVQGYLLGRPLPIGELKDQSQSYRSRRMRPRAAGLPPQDAKFFAGRHLAAAPASDQHGQCLS